MIDEMLTFLARAPTLGDLSLTWGQAGPRLGTGGVYLRGVKVLQTKTDLLGCQNSAAVRNFCCGSACRCQQGTPTPPCKTPAAWRHCRRGSRPKAPQAARLGWATANPSPSRSAPRAASWTAPTRAAPRCTASA